MFSADIITVENEFWNSDATLWVAAHHATLELIFLVIWETSS